MKGAITISAYTLSDYMGYKNVTRDNERFNHYLGIYSLKLHGLQKSNP